jgi:Flp pilus assembly protein TadG
MANHIDNDHAGARGALRSERGAALVEFAIAATLFLTLIYGAISYGVMFWVKNGITHAAGEGARSSIRGLDPVAEAKAAAEAVIDKTLPAANAPYAKPVSPTVGTCATEPSKTCVTVTVTYPYSAHPIVPALPFLPLLPSQLRSTSVVQLP